jgi:glycosyltransferase involved in cell wall biosynthesis
VFITQNGDWPAFSDDSEFRLFGCDGLVCTNPDYLERNREKYRCALIPNGVDLRKFAPGAAERSRFGLPGGPIVLMVSALIASKNVAEGIRAVAAVPGATLVVAGDGPLRDDMRRLADEILPGRYCQLTVAADEMPALYRCADVFMHLSTDESFGNVFVEALATGLSIVAFDTPRTRWIIGEEGCFPDARTTEDLATAVHDALNRGKTQQAASRTRAEGFGWPAIAAQYADFFAEVCQ